MLTAETLTFQEFIMQEKLPLSTIHNAVFEFLRGRDDVVVYGAQAVNAYVHEPRMTQDIDLLSVHASKLAHELQEHLRERFHIAVRIRQVAKGVGYRLYQVRKSGSRHLVDLRSAEALPAARRIAKVLVAAPEELLASKVFSYHQRRGKPKSGTDWRDIAMLLLVFPELKRKTGPVAELLQARVDAGADPEILTVWGELVAQEITSPDEDDGA